MTRILLHPRLLPRYGPTGGARVYLPPPWHWWRHKLRRCPDGNMYHQQYDDPRDVNEFSLLFDLLDMTEIHDPPAMHLTTFTSEFQHIWSGDYEHTSLLSRGETTECDVVWYQRPSEHWHQLPGTTCRPGDYEISSVDRREDMREGQRRDSTEPYYSSSMPVLRWELANTEPERARMTYAFGGTGRWLVGMPGGEHDSANYQICQCGQRGCPSSRTPSVTQVLSGANLEDTLQQILHARREYEMRNRDRAVTILMNNQDWEQLRREALRSEEERERGSFLFEQATSRRPFDTVFGLEVRAERSVPRGQVIVMGTDTGRVVNWGNPMREPGTLRGAELAAEMYAAIERVRAQGYGILSPDDVRRIQGSPPGPSPNIRPPSTNVLPEAEVVDEIDRLVNEQVRVGPVDDYSINRYPKCKHCPHDWHGILCDDCACLGELEDPV